MTRYKLNTPEWSKELFDVANAITYTIDLPFTRETWHGRIKACRGIGASSLSKESIAEWEKEHLAYLNSMPNAFTIPHYITILDLKRKTVDE